LASDDPIQLRTGQMQTIAQQAKQGASNAVSGYLNGTLPGPLPKKSKFEK
jgi:hypothetical protein